jgi:DNA-binding transcriptional LysR family regulator
LPKAISIFSKRYPRIRISIKELPYHEIFSAISEHSGNVAFLSINEEYFLEQFTRLEKPNSLHHNIMLTDRLVACVPAHSPLADKEMVEQSDIMTRPFTYLNIVPLVKHKTQYSNLALYTSSNIEFHRRILQEMDAVSLMPRYVYQNLFDSKHVVAKPLEGAQQIIYHAALYPDATPNPFVKELTNIVASLL